MTPHPAAKDFPFKFQLSYWTLWSWRRKLQVHAADLDSQSDVDEWPELLPGSDGLVLRCIRLDDSVATVGIAEHRGQRLLRYVLQRMPRYYIDMAGSDFEDYKSKFSGKTRSTLTRKVKKFAEHCGGELRWQRFDQPDTLDRFWELAREVSVKTYQERLLNAGLPDDPAFRARAREWVTNGALRAFLLFHGERPVSYLFCPVHNGVVDYAYLGYDPAYQRLSAGTVLQWLALESLFAEGKYRYFDFTEGESEHKRLFATGHLDCAHVALLRPTLRHRLLVLSHHRFNQATETLGRWLERHQMKARVRRWLRVGSTAA